MGKCYICSGYGNAPIRIMEGVKLYQLCRHEALNKQSRTYNDIENFIVATVVNWKFMAP